MSRRTKRLIPITATTKDGATIRDGVMPNGIMRICLKDGSCPHKRIVVDNPHDDKCRHYWCAAVVVPCEWVVYQRKEEIMPSEQEGGAE